MVDPKVAVTKAELVKELKEIKDLFELQLKNLRFLVARGISVLHDNQPALLKQAQARIDEANEITRKSLVAMQILHVLAEADPFNDHIAVLENAETNLEWRTHGIESKIILLFDEFEGIIEKIPRNKKVAEFYDLHGLANQIVTFYDFLNQAIEELAVEITYIERYLK